MDSTILYALAANLFFSSSSIVFAQFSRKHSSLWINAVKSSLAFACLLLIVPIFVGFHPLPPLALALFVLSGLLGLVIGDVFLFNAYRILGAGRTLMIFGFQPLIIGSMAYLLFNQAVDAHRFLGIIFFVACLLIFSLETRRMHGHWEWRGLIGALLGLLFDATGVLLTRHAFDMSPGLTSIEANLFRFFGAILGFAFIARFIRPIGLVEKFLSETPRHRALVVAACVCGTLLSLSFYLAALQKGNLATISGIAITAPLFATLLECLIAKKWPSIYLWTALASFAAGFWIILS
ncbi:MAG: DMT family transporter [Bdellovibrionota bacterium]